MNKIKVLVVDDSALIRKLLTDILDADFDITVVGSAEDPFDAREKIKKLNPDVITLDIEMPKMDGLTFLEKLMRLHPMPVVMVSTLTEKGAEATMRALKLGAVDFLPKPTMNVEKALNDYSDDLISKVKAANETNIHALLSSVSSLSPMDALPHKNIVSSPKLLACNTTVKLVAIGSSTGGTEAIAKVVKDIPVDFPGIVITQHIPAKFSEAFAGRLNRSCSVTIVEADDGQSIEKGHVYIAPGDHHLAVVKDRDGYKCRVFSGERVNRHCPSVEVLFKSIAQHVGPDVISVMLTGMGKDGATAMQEIHNQGGATIAQDKNSSVVWGMPGAAVALGCVDSVVPLDKIAAEMMQICRSKGKPSFSKSMPANF